MKRLLALALVVLSSCSYALTHGPATSMLTDTSVGCTSHHGYTIVDAVVGVAAAAAGATVIILEQKDEPDYKSVPTYTIGIPLAAIGAVFLASSSHGHGKVSRCRQALRRRETFAR